MLQDHSTAADAISAIRANHHHIVLLFRKLWAPQHPAARKPQWDELRVALEIEVTIESEVFLPAFFDATEDALQHFITSLNHQSILAHVQDVAGASILSRSFDFRLRSLQRAVEHHVWEMERDDGILNEARRSTMDHDLVGRQLRALEQNLVSEYDSAVDTPLA